MTNLLGSSFTPTTAYAKRLSISVASNATTIYVSSVLDRDGLVIPLSATNKGYFTLEPGTSREESIVCTSASSTLRALTGCTRGLAASGSSEEGSSARAYSHNAGSKIIMTDIAQFFGNFVNFASPEAASSFSPTTDYHLTTKTWVENRNGYWEGAAANFAALPLTDNADGAARVTLDDSKLYVWASSTQAWNLAGAGGGAGTVYIDTFLGTDSTGGDNQTFTLTSGSYPDKKYLQVYLNGILMEEGATNDYVATSSNAVIFNVAVLDDDKVTMLVVSVDLYNPAWNSVNADILPDVDSAYDIGSTTKKFKDGYFAELNADTYSGDGVIDPDNISATSSDEAYKLVKLDNEGSLPSELLSSYTINVAALSSTTPVITSAAEVGTQSTTYVPLKSIFIKNPGYLTVQYTDRVNNNAGNTGIARNGEILASYAAVLNTETVREATVFIGTGGILQIVALKAGDGTVYVKNLNIYFTDEVSNLTYLIL